MPSTSEPIDVRPRDARPLTVSEITKQIRSLVAGEFRSVWVVGEISDFKGSKSGHIYFSLIDKDARLAVALFRKEAAQIRFALQNGLSVIARGHIDVYVSQGKHQLIVDLLEPKGIGALELAARQLKAKLQAEGLFASERKRKLPLYPRRIALVTSRSSAAVGDMIKVIGGRWPMVELWVQHVATQGATAASEIVAAIRLLNRIAGIDLMIVGRGGGSQEDLQPFNEEMVGRAIAASRIPVVSAVGHEVDFTIADAVADRRAATPSNAGQLVVPDQAEMHQRLRQLASRLAAKIRGRSQSARQRLDKIAERRLFLSPYDPIRSRQQHCDGLSDRMGRALASQLRIAHRRQTLDQLHDRLVRLLQNRLCFAREQWRRATERWPFRATLDSIAKRASSLETVQARIVRAIGQVIEVREQRVANFAGRLDSLSPLRVLARGYSMTLRSDAHTVVRSAGDVEVGDLIVTRLNDGEIESRVESREHRG